MLKLSSKQVRRIHLWLTTFWAAMVPVAILSGLVRSVVFISIISLYANFAAHFAGWQGSRAEEAAAEEEE